MNMHNVGLVVTVVCEVKVQRLGVSGRLGLALSWPPQGHRGCAAWGAVSSLQSARDSGESGLVSGYFSLGHAVCMRHYPEFGAAQCAVLMWKPRGTQT